MSDDCELCSHEHFPEDPCPFCDCAHPLSAGEIREIKADERAQDLKDTPQGEE